MKSKKLWGALVAVLTVAGVGLVAQPAMAAETAPAPNQACWLELNTGHEACADSPTELGNLLLTEYATVILGPETQPEAGAAYAPTVAARSALAPEATYILGTHYGDPNYGGSSRTITESVEPNPCSQAGSYVYGYEANMGSWNDAVGSFQGFGHCGFRFFADANFGGSSYGPYFSRTDMGSFYRQASSFDTQKVN